MPIERKDFILRREKAPSEVWTRCLEDMPTSCDESDDVAAVSDTVLLPNASGAVPSEPCRSSSYSNACICGAELFKLKTIYLFVALIRI